MEVKTQHGKLSIHLLLPGLYNAYNALGAFALADDELKVNMGYIEVGLSKTQAAFGRFERIRVEDREVYLLLIKNPTGFNQILQTFLRELKTPVILVAINDNDADGRDISWLWDVSLEELRQTSPNVIASGVRAADMALRLKYEGITAMIHESLDEAFEKALHHVPKGEKLYVLPTYTAMLGMRSVIGKRVKVPQEWQS
jgi:UDP-N-acetylmuramyl tripeptide synthase